MGIIIVLLVHYFNVVEFAFIDIQRKFKSKKYVYRIEDEQQNLERPEGLRNDKYRFAGVRWYLTYKTRAKISIEYQW